MLLADANVLTLDVTENDDSEPTLANIDIRDLDAPEHFDRYITGEEKFVHIIHVIVLLTQVRSCGQMCGDRRQQSSSRYLQARYFWTRGRGTQSFEFVKGVSCYMDAERSSEIVSLLRASLIPILKQIMSHKTQGSR